MRGQLSAGWVHLLKSENAENVWVRDDLAVFCGFDYPGL